jgi:hypothetical protein
MPELSLRSIIKVTGVPGAAILPAAQPMAAANANAREAAAHNQQLRMSFEDRTHIPGKAFP